VLYSSDILLTYSLHTEHLYVDKLLRRRVRNLPHPGFLGYYAQPTARQVSYGRLGIPLHTEFVFLCFSYMHSEREIVQLIEAFFETTSILQGRQPSWSPVAVPRLQLPERWSPPSSAAVLQREGALQLLLVGAPGDKKLPAQILQRAAGNTAIHFFLEAHEEDMPLYLGAAHAIVMPHFPSPAAGVLETAMLALSYERVVIAPDLPRFRGLLPADASVLYDPFSKASLAQALITAPARIYHLTEEGRKALDVEESWQLHTERLLAVYRHLLRS
jgi:glycosyltransferase involved in cell wall biosynthesis